MKKLMDCLYDNIDEAVAFSLSFTNFVYFYDDLCWNDFQTTVCEKCKKAIQDKDYLVPKANCKKPYGILQSYEFGVSRELRDELISRFDVTENDFRPICTKKGDIIFYQITPQNVMLPMYEENNWLIRSICSQCGSVQYDMQWHYNEKDEGYAFISQEALDNMRDFNITYERDAFFMPQYIISRRVYGFLTERYPRTHYFPFFLK